LQLKVAGSKFAALCHRYTELAIEHHQALRAVSPLRTAVKKLKIGTEWLSAVHADFILACLVSKCYSIALPFLNEDIYELGADGITSRDLLLYYYYGGMVYVGLKQYKKAVSFFKIVITTPAVVLSNIMVEAYKKFMLTSLILYGKVTSLPRQTSSVLQRYHKNAFPQYTDFVNSFNSNNLEEVHKIAATHAETFQKDHNFGLVKQCIQRLTRNNIQRFTQTYLTLSLDEITKQVGLANTKETEAQIPSYD